MAGELILIIEDNEKNRRLVRDVLQFKGYQTIESETGEEGVELARGRQPALVLMDIQLPGIDGYEATRRIRRAESDADARPVPIFALTADALETGRKACLVAGMDGFLTKPVDPAEIDAVLATIIPSTVVAAE